MVTVQPRGTVKVVFDPSGVLGSVRVDQGVVRQSPGVTPEEPLSGELAAVGQDRERRLVVGEAIIPPQAEAAAELPRPLGIGNELVTHDAHRVVELGLLDGRVLRVLRIGLHGVGPVFPAPAAIPARQGFEEAVILPRILVRTRVEPAEAGVTLHRLAPGAYAVGERLGDRLQEHVDPAHRDLPAAHHGRRMDRVGHGALGREHPDRFIEPGVHRQVRVGQAAEEIRTGRVRLREGRVHRGAALGAGPRQVERDRCPHRSRSARPAGSAHP